MGNEGKKNKHINFRIATEMYMKLMEYLKKTNESLSKVMREATFDYLQLKEKMFVNKIPEGVKCEIDYSKMQSGGCS